MAPKQDLLDRSDRAAEWADHFDKDAHATSSTLRNRLMRDLAQHERAAANLYRRLAQITAK